MKKYTKSYKHAQIKRELEVKGLVINNYPSISISIFSNIISNVSLKDFLSKLSDEEKNKIGELEIYVKSKFSNHKGRITKIVGKLVGLREKLLALSSDSSMKEVIGKAGDDEIVVEILDERNKRTYEYIESALILIIKPSYALDVKNKLGIKEEWNKLFDSLKIKPQERKKILDDILKILESNKFPIKSSKFNSKDYPKLFKTSKDIPFEAKVRTKSKVFDRVKDKIIENLREGGLYKRNEKFDSNPLKITIIDGIEKNKKDYLNKILDLLKSLKFECQILDKIELKKDVIYDNSKLHSELEKIVKQSEKPDIFLAFFPTKDLYYNFKKITLKEQIASQVILEKTINNEYAIDNIVLGILGKTGNIPFVLAKPLEIVDYIIGIDIGREKKKRLAGSQSVPAIVRIYSNNGEFFEYYIDLLSIEGETLTINAIRDIFPASIFENKGVIIHRDGRFPASEKEAFLNWAKEISAKFYLVEIIKTGSPRIYLSSQEDITSPDVGTTFLLNDKEAKEAFIITSSSKIGTPLPLHIRIDRESDFNINDAIYSILSMRLLHYGSSILPRLPVTIHYANKIANMLLKGVKPKNLKGKDLYWL